ARSTSSQPESGSSARCRHAITSLSACSKSERMSVTVRLMALTPPARISRVLPSLKNTRPSTTTACSCNKDDERIGVSPFVMWCMGGIRPASAGKARKSERLDVDTRRAAQDQVGHQFARGGTDAEPVAGKPRGQIKPRYAVHLRHHRQGVRRDIDIATPGVRDTRRVENREGRRQPPPCRRDRARRRRGIKHAAAFERADIIQRKAARNSQFLEEPLA